ncbi:MAG TPA: hypothetical protein DCX12_01500 [Chloroflexi bacterium]|jgi:quercetin dioxygenase-like cupin family protein|nr:hypothetical protein [Chloroflexota bacterium]HBV93628.1 hypothetical protein [Chloroflexota bacterium]
MPLAVTGRDRRTGDGSVKRAGRSGSDGIDGEHTREVPMAHFVLPDIASTVEIQAGAVVSRVIFRDSQTEVTVFGFAAGEGLSEHQASRAAIVQVLKGRLELIADGERLDAEPGFWLHMEPGTPHGLTAREPTIMLLTLVGAG